VDCSPLIAEEWRTTRPDSLFGRDESVPSAIGNITMRRFVRTLPFVLVTVLVVTISLALFIGLSLGIGWILTLFLPFSLFEATLLGMLAAVVTGLVWYSVFRSLAVSEFIEDKDESEPDEIPESRFWESPVDRTWKNWFRYVLANSVYEDLLDSPPSGLAMMKEKQLQELSIRLADTALGGLEAKSPRTKQLRVSKGMLKQQLIKMGQQPYDDDILDAAVAAMNVDLRYLDEPLRKVIRERLWDEPKEVF
jgi:hypothetical protein